jgi:S-formylglutathione hydrolase FrmB
MTSAMVIIPENAPGPFPVLYLLHGLSDDHTAWTRRTSIERYVQGVPLMVVMPNGERGWYSDSATVPTSAFETFITSDLIGFVDGAFQTKACREGRAVCGLSMGGYGAFKLALKHPDLFRAAASLSGALDLRARLNPDNPRYDEMRLVFGETLSASDDVLALIETADRSTMPALWMDCGAEDGLLDGNRRTHEHLNSLGIAHDYSERPGGHSWDHWDKVIVDALVFLKRELGISTD